MYFRGFVMVLVYLEQGRNVNKHKIDKMRWYDATMGCPCSWHLTH